MKIEQISRINDGCLVQGKSQARMADQSKGFSRIMKGVFNQHNAIHAPTSSQAEQAIKVQAHEGGATPQVKPEMPSPLQYLSLVDYLNNNGKDTPGQNPDVNGDGYIGPTDLLAWIDNYNKAQGNWVG